MIGRMHMKKVLCVCLAAVFVLILCSCTKDREENAGDTTSETASDTSVPVISLVADKETVSPGDTVNVTVNISNAPLTACYEISVFADEKLSFVDSRETDKSEMINEGVYNETDTPYFFMTGIIFSACDLTDNDMFVITYRVSEDAVSGDELSLTVNTSSFHLATDETGDETADIFNSVLCNGISLKVE